MSRSSARLTRATALAFILTLLAGAGTAWSVAPRVPGGDEPHYLVITQSLLKDGDLRIENNHRRRDYASFFPGDLRPVIFRRGKNGQIYSIHAPGVSVLVLPAFSLFGYRGAQGAVLLLTALAGALVWRIGWRATADAGAAWFAWAAVIGSPTFLLQSFSVYPDGSGALAVAAAVWLLLLLREPAARVRDWQLASVGAGLAALPWLHTRFAVIAAGFGIAILWRLLANPEATTAERRQRAIVFLAIPIASALAWFAFFQIVYGTPNPAAPYGGDTHSSLAYVPVGLAGLLFDQQFGLIACAPVLAFAVVQYLRPRRDASERVAAVAGIVALAYLAAVACYWMWWAGQSRAAGAFRDRNSSGARAAARDRLDARHTSRPPRARTAPDRLTAPQWCLRAVAARRPRVGLLRRAGALAEVARAGRQPAARVAELFLAVESRSPDERIPVCHPSCGVAGGPGRDGVAGHDNRATPERGKRVRARGGLERRDRAVRARADRLVAESHPRSRRDGPSACRARGFSGSRNAA